MLSIIGTGAAGAGTEFGLLKQRFDSMGNYFVVKGLAAQYLFCFCGAEGSCTTGSNGDTNTIYDILLAFEPDRAVQDGKGNSLRTHDALETGSLSFFGLREIKANNEFFAFFERGFARPEE